MPADPYLVRLGMRLNAGLVRMDPERRERHRGFVLAQQQPDGGFCGRGEESDLYYTSFAVRCLTLLGGLTPDECRRIGRYVQSQSPDQLSTVDLVSRLYMTWILQAAGRERVPEAPAGWADRMADVLESVRTEDGGYAKTREGAAGSTYHSFLITVTYELLALPVPNPHALIQFVYDRQRDDGGFVEIAPMKRSGTNPTAAAVALLGLLDRVDDELREDVRDFLLDVYSPEGGFLANTRIPFPDGLSTFTGLLTAQDIGFGRMIDADRMEKYVTRELEVPTGGFRGAGWDEQPDVEYTFYGLGILGLLWSAGMVER